MSIVWRNLATALMLVGVVILIAVIVLIVVAERYQRGGPSAQERRAREAAIQPLLQSHASREQVARTLGLEFVDYSVGSSNRWEIEQRVSNPRVRETAKQFPGILLHASMDTMTWLFFDSEDKLRDYHVCAQ